MEQFKTISTFDVKGPIRKKDHLRVIERLQDQIKALQAQIDETFNIPSASPIGSTRAA